MSALSCQEDTHHCAIFPGDDHSGAAHQSFQECTLNPGHEKFLTVEEFLKTKLTDIFKSKRDQKTFINYVNRTVRVLTSYTSEGRPDKYCYSKTPYPFKDFRGSSVWMRYGTGFLDMVSLGESVKNKPCPCLDCEMSKDEAPKLVECSYYFVVVTAAHIIFDKCEAQRSVFEFFYDVEPRGEGIMCLYGVDVLDFGMDKFVTDRCRVLCVTHDASLAKILEGLCIPKGRLHSLNETTGILISHPHGTCKRISVGEFKQVKCIAQANTASIKLKKGRQIRFSGYQDMTDIVKQINDQLIDDNPVIGYIESDETKTLGLLCDVTVSHHSNIAVECGLKGRRFESAFYDFNNSWWRLPPGIDLVTENGKRFTLPHGFAVANENIAMELFIKDTIISNSLLRDYKRNKTFGLTEFTNCFSYLTYNMASCPGSSGGIVFENMMPKFSFFDTCHHFGSLGDYNRSIFLDNGMKWPHCLPLADDDWEFHNVKLIRPHPLHLLDRIEKG